MKGSVFLRVIDEGKFRCIEVKEGEFFMLPRMYGLCTDTFLAYTHHSPLRPADTIGVVLERNRDIPGMLRESNS